MERMRIKIVYRKNLKMSPGKLAAQCVHAAIGLDVSEDDINIDVVILGMSDKKYFDTVTALDELRVYRFRDAGYTEVPPGTETCAAFYEKAPERKRDVKE